MRQIAFEFGQLTVTWYGILMALAFIVGLWTASRRAPHAGIHSDRIYDLGVWLIVGGILGARLFYVLGYWDRFQGQPWWEIFMVQRGGLVYYGGLIGASAMGITYCLLKKLPLWRTADVLAPSLALGYAFGRFGCLMNGCCHGSHASVPWAIHFPQEHVTAGAPVHPTQIYDAGLSLALFFGLAWLFRRRTFDGQVFAAYLIVYAALRSFVELFRGDYPVYYLGVLTQAHLVSVAILAGGLLLFWKLPRPAMKGQRLEGRG